MQDTTQPRILKVYPFFVMASSGTIIRSQIRLMGKWLVEAGFPPYTFVSVEVSPQELIIRPYVQG